LRPATLGDGISRLEDHDRTELLVHHEEACLAGRVSSFIPASGSGTRLFHSLLELHRDQETDLDRLRSRASRGDSVAKDALVVLDNIRGFAIWPELESRGCSPDSIEQILRGLFGSGGVWYHLLPKGLIPFHLYNDGVRSAFAEHLDEAAQLTANKQARRLAHCHVHFTIGEAHIRLFERARETEASRIEEAIGVQCRVTFSVQSHATDTIASEPNGSIRRDGEGCIVFHPGGHGALVRNLAQLDADVVLIKNIDNATRQEALPQTVDVRRQICGLLVKLEKQVHDSLRRLSSGRDAEQAINLLERLFGIKPSAPLLDDKSKRQFATFQLNRPIRVCGVVSAFDHNGGRPFWTDTPGRGPSLQIVEGSEVDLGDAGTRELFYRSRHFNPVDIACSLRDSNKEPFKLDAFTVPGRAIIARKLLTGVPSLVYEHPGLWNGAMGLWNTAFVEVPDFTFNPVKSLADLWEPGHHP